jgi:hypothetical protein
MALIMVSIYCCGVGVIVSPTRLTLSLNAIKSNKQFVIDKDYKLLLYQPGKQSDHTRGGHNKEITQLLLKDNCLYHMMTSWVVMTSYYIF